MPNKIKYNSGVDANAMNIETWSVASKLGMGPSNITDFKNGLEIPEGGYVIYSGSNISGRIANNDSELIYLINKLGSNSSTKEAALQWAKDNNVLVLNRALENIATDGLTLQLDAKHVASYFNTNVWYGLDNNDITVILNNSPEHKSDRYISFNGTNQYATFSSENSFNTGGGTDYTFEVWFKMRQLPTAAYGANGHIWGGENGNDVVLYLNPAVDGASKGIMVYDDSRYNGAMMTNSGFKANEWNQWVIVGDGTNNTVTHYINGEIDRGPTGVSPSSQYQRSWAGTRLAYDARWGTYSTLDLSTARQYDRKLTEAEVSQNYFNGPITTRNLQQHYDFNNLVCYETGNTTIKNLVNTSQVSTITNTASAISFNNQMGYLEWTGDSNAYIDIPDTGQMPKFSLSTWVWNDPTGANSRHSILRNYWEIVDTSIQFWSYDFDNDYWRSSGNGAVPYNEWTHITTTWDGSVIRHYINGILYWTDPNTSGGTSQSLYNFGGYNGRILDGKYATLSIYNDTLTDQEILNNYNAHAVRFK